MFIFAVISTLSAVPHLMRLRDGADSFSCSGYNGEVRCSDIVRRKDSYVDVHLGSCNNSCAGKLGYCHAGVTEVQLLVGDCDYGTLSTLSWVNATQPPGSDCKGDTDFVFIMRDRGCISNVTVRSVENNVTLNFIDYSSAGLQTNILLNLTCPGIEQAALRDIVKCTAYSGHQGTYTSKFTFFNASNDISRVTFLDTKTGTASGDTWTPPVTHYFTEFQYTLPVGLVDNLKLAYEVQHFSGGTWVAGPRVNMGLSNVAPLPPKIKPTDGSTALCTNLTRDTWKCEVQVRDDLGPVRWSTPAWQDFDVTYNVTGCELWEVEVYGYEAIGPAAFSFNFTRLQACIYKDLNVSLSVLTDSQLLSSGVMELYSPGLVTMAPPTLAPTPEPTPPHTPTPTFPHKDKASHDMLYAGFGAAALVLLVIGFGFFLRLHYKKDIEEAGTWCQLGPDKSEGPVKEVVVDEEGPTTQMAEMGALNADYTELLAE
eukprot:TRINITY_DN6005_c0_g1_i1.p1 TRINITY_DN6005_c0_g1~~TRINITY_DN6005_c0_g1_i1.p1  ORF type:complete len:483 (+),score=95.64 TRINITY_DN6005_c0_g1_i1:46-1494(+)